MEKTKRDVPPPIEEKDKFFVYIGSPPDQKKVVLRTASEPELLEALKACETSQVIIRQQTINQLMIDTAAATSVYLIQYELERRRNSIHVVK